MSVILLPDSVAYKATDLDFIVICFSLCIC